MRHVRHWLFVIEINGEPWVGKREESGGMNCCLDR
jgi:hypothetical protein